MQTCLEVAKIDYLCTAIENDSSAICPGGGIGRRAGLKHQWIHFHPGSTPGLGTNLRRQLRRFFYSSRKNTETILSYIKNLQEKGKKNGRTRMDPPNFAKLTQYT